jgi:ATP phosphoribosyltransferase
MKYVWYINVYTDRRNRRTEVLVRLMGTEKPTQTEGVVSAFASVDRVVEDRKFISEMELLASMEPARLVASTIETMLNSIEEIRP